MLTLTDANANAILAALGAVPTGDINRKRSPSLHYCGVR
jgi:hypothetical protein